jgi:membrane protein HdeD
LDKIQEGKNMEKNGTALILIVLGLIVLAFPLLGIIPLSLVTGFIVLFLGLGLIFAGLMDMGESASAGIVQIILGIIALILGIGFIFNPGLFSWLIGFIVWISGLFLIIAGIIGILTKAGDSRWNGVIALVIGILYIVVGTFITNPVILGALIGLWLIITGAVMLFVKE